MIMATFKKEYPDLVESVITECDIYSSVGKRFHTDRALWDTGADTTIISSRIAKQLQLKPLRKGYITGVGGDSSSNVFLVHIQLPTGDFVTDVEAMEDDYYDYDVIIGTDVIMFGDFLISNAEEKTTFQFRTPSEGGIDL
jgi:hypothetical protein